MVEFTVSAGIGSEMGLRMGELVVEKLLDGGRLVVVLLVGGGGALGRVALSEWILLMRVAHGVWLVSRNFDV